MSNLQPFQWPVPENMEVVTRSGEKVTQLTKFDTVMGENIVGVLEGMLYSWNMDGILKATLGRGGCDLFLRPIPRERWVVVVERNGSNWVAAIEESEKNAELSQEKILNVYPDSRVSIHKITLPLPKPPKP